MAEPDLGALSDQERATFWTGAIVRNSMLLEVTLRSILRSLGRKHPADPVPGEPADFEPLMAAVTSGIDAKFEPDGRARDREALEEGGSVHRLNGRRARLALGRARGLGCLPDARPAAH